MTHVQFELNPQTGQAHPVLVQLPPTLKMRLDTLIALAQKASGDDERRNSFKEISAVHLLASTYHPVPPGRAHPLEGARAADYWIDYIFTEAGL